MKKTVFVVLHYETLDDTVKCLDSLEKYLQDPHVEIVLVDNGSKNGKLSAIEADYRKNRIHFIYSEKNLGFGAIGRPDHCAGQ